MSLILGKAETLMENIASNQGWSQCNIQTCNKSEEVLEEVCALSTKMDILLNWLEQRANYKKDRQATQDAFNSQNTCEEYLGVEFPEYQEDANIVINNSTPQQQGQGWRQQQQRSSYQGKYPGNYFNSSNSKQPSLRDLILEQARINENISKKLAFNNKVLENINTKMDSFSSAIKDQLSYSKKIESQLAQLVAALPIATNLVKVNTITTRGGKCTRDPPYPTRIGKTLVVVQEEEKKNDEVEEIEPQAQEVMQDFHDMTLLLFPCKN
jgi:hypothetical protein